MDKKKFWKTVIQIEVLSEESPIGDGLELSQIDYAITEGDCSGKLEVIEQVELSPQEAAKVLIAQGSDPEFFGLDAEGNETDD